MNNYYRAVFFFVLIAFITAQAFAQEHQEENSETAHFRKNSISASIAHAHVKQGIENGIRDWLTIASFMLDYNYRFNENWMAGIHTDFLLESFQIERQDGEGDENYTVIEREKPVLVVGAVSYKPVHFLAIVAGGGIEFEKEKDYGVLRIGIEPAIEISETWETVFSLNYDVKIKGYDTWNIGVGIAWLF